MLTSRKKSSDARAVLSRPVERALHRLGQDISAARRVRRLSQEDLAQRVGTSLSTVRRMEDGYPGTALHTFLRALHVFFRTLENAAPDSWGERVIRRAHARLRQQDRQTPALEHVDFLL